MSEVPKRTDEEGEVVYRRLPEPEKLAEEAARKGAAAVVPGGRRFAPTLKPLAVGFALLLTIVFVFGSISVRELETVENGTFNLQDQLTSRIRLFLNLNAAAVSLENEARMRAVGESRGELMPPFELRLRDARKRVTDLLEQLERPPYSQQSNWSGLRERLAQYVELTKDLETYSNNGFVQFRGIQEQLRLLDIDLKRERDEVIRQSEALKFRSTRRVTVWWMSAMVIALLVIAATIWEVQRRFRHEQQSLDEARRERQFSTQMLEGMVSAIAAIDAHSRIRSANTAFFEIFPQASIGASVYDRFAAPDAMKMLEAVVAEEVTSAAYRGRWVLNENQPGAQQKTFDVYSSPLEMDKEMGQIVTLVDVSEAVEAESVLRRTEALAAVGQASAQVAHEIKNPLGSIRLGVSMLRDMTNDREAISTIDLVERGIDHLNKLVVDVTQFSRQKALTLTEFDLNEAVAASLDLVTDRIHDKHTPIKKHFSPEPLLGRWDEDQLLQVFVNLIANAIDAAPANSPVTITTERVMANLQSHSDTQPNGTDSITPIKQPAARITIRDEGSGMDDATLAQIFEPFFTTKKRGTGLGLAIVKQIVEKHGGHITVHSTPNQGTSFIVDLPLKAAKTDE